MKRFPKILTALAALSFALCLSLPDNTSNSYAADRQLLDFGKSGQGTSGSNELFQKDIIGASRGGDLQGTSNSSSGNFTRGLGDIGPGGFGGAPDFQTGFDPAKAPSWSEWLHQEVAPTPWTPLEFQKDFSQAPLSRQISPEIFQPAAQFRIQPQDTTASADNKLDRLTANAARAVHELERNAGVRPQGAFDGMMDEAEERMKATDAMYADIQDMFADIDKMYKALDANYDTLNKYESVTQEMASAFNATSDAMADHVGGMVDAVDSMLSQVDRSVDSLKAMLGALDSVKKGGADVSKNYDMAAKEIGNYSKALGASLGALKGRGLELEKRAGDTNDYLNRINNYIKELKNYDVNQAGDVDGVRKYLQDVLTYLEKVKKDLQKTKEDLKKAEDYFRSAKVEANAEENANAGICESAEPKGMSELRECAKTCRTVCRWKKNVAGIDCYECPSPSAETCYDVGAWPANHPWCNPGGVCYDDPMLYCTPFGTVSPNGTRLQCTNCKARPDECWKHFGEGMTLTNCKLGCWNGTCEYIGKYTEQDYDGNGIAKDEFVHCYKCVTPPPPPTCEELGWGYDWQADCERNCPDPGKCEEFTMPGGKKKGDDKDGDGEDDADDGDDDDADDADDGGGDTGTDDGGDDDDDGGKPADPPGGTPGEPGGGGGATAGGEGSGGGATEGTPQEPQNPPGNRPGGSAPTQPTQPTTDKLPVKEGEPPTPPEPPEPITSPEIDRLQSRLANAEERIEHFNEIIDDPGTGPTATETATGYREDATKERDKILEQIEEEKEKELERRRQEAEAEKRREEDRIRSAERYRRYQQIDIDARNKWRKKQMDEFKEANDNLRTRAQEMQQSLEARQKRLQDLDTQIDYLNRTNEHYTSMVENDSFDEDQAEEIKKKNQAEIDRLTRLRNDHGRSYVETQREYQRELEELKSQYRKKLFAVDEGARRRAEIERIDYYYERNEELRRLEKTREVSDRAFASITRDMQSQIDEAKANGDDDKAEELQKELDNITRGKAEWDAVYESRERTITNELRELSWQNFDEGAGPQDPEHLKKLFSEYSDLLGGQLNQVDSVIEQWEAGLKDGTVGSETQADLDTLKQQRDQLQSTIEGLNAQKSTLDSEYQLTQEDVDNITNSANRIVGSSRYRGEDKSFARLFAESLGEEIIHTARPDVFLKKAAAFSWGVAKGVTKAVAGLAQLGLGAADLMYESYAQALGFEDGGIFGTDATDTLYSVLDTIGSNLNFDGIVKAAVAAGGIIDAELTRLEKSSDIDWDTAEFGGQVTGEVVVGDAVIAGALGKAGKLLSGVDEVTDAARAADRIGDGARTGTRLDPTVPDTTIRTPDIDAHPPRAPDAGDGPTGTAPRAADDLPPRTPDTDATSPRGPPHRQYDNTQPLPRSDKPVKPLDDATAARLENENGFRADHAQSMHRYAQEHDAFLIVRDGNVESVKFFDDPNMMPKPMSSKAKTAQVGPEANRGRVVDPTHPTQAKYWDDAIDAAAHHGMETGDYSRLDDLVKARKKAVDAWDHYGDEMQRNGYSVNSETGIIEYTDPVTGQHFSGVHGDYDLHGVYRQAPDGTMEQVSFGSGQKFDGQGVDVEGAALRNQINSEITPGGKKFFQHGGQDDWIPDPDIVPNKGPDPPATVFFPDGRPPVRLETAEQMQKFYESELGGWQYADTAPKK